MSEYVAIGVCFLLAWAWVGWKAGELWLLRKDMLERERWAEAYLIREQKKGAA